VIDRLYSAGEHEYRLHWLLPDFRREGRNGGWGALFTGHDGTISAVEVATSGAGALTSWMRADEPTGRGWASPRYLERVPAWSWEVRACGTTVWFATHFGRSATALALTEGEVRVGGVTLALSTERDGPLLRGAFVRSLVS